MASLDTGLEHFSAKWIRFAVKKCGKPKKRDDSTSVETALGQERQR
jgi:putative endonuclease